MKLFFTSSMFKIAHLFSLQAHSNCCYMLTKFCFNMGMKNNLVWNWPSLLRKYTALQFPCFIMKIIENDLITL